MTEIRWGILTCGNIAHKFAQDLMLVEGAKLTAVASREESRAKAFAEKFSIPSYFGSYEELASCPEVDVVYVASPHSHHYEHVMMCLEHGKAVLCEKPFAINSAQAAEMVELARKKGVFLMEALWTRFLPHYTKVLEMLDAGAIGRPKGIMANFGFKGDREAFPRLFEPSLGGGSLMDVGIYPVFFALSMFGKPDSIVARMDVSSRYVDEQCSMIFQYRDGRIATLFSSIVCDLATDAEIFGTEGRIKLNTRFTEPSCDLEHYRDGEAYLVPVLKELGHGYQYEARHVQKCLQKGLTESPIWSLTHTLDLMETLGKVRKEIGLFYGADIHG